MGHALYISSVRFFFLLQQDENTGNTGKMENRLTKNEPSPLEDERQYRTRGRVPEKPQEITAVKQLIMNT